jgi:hypothetical protein
MELPNRGGLGGPPDYPCLFNGMAIAESTPMLWLLAELCIRRGRLKVFCSISGDPLACNKILGSLALGLVIAIPLFKVP